MISIDKSPAQSSPASRTKYIKSALICLTLFLLTSCGGGTATVAFKGILADTTTQTGTNTVVGYTVTIKAPQGQNLTLQDINDNITWDTAPTRIDVLGADAKNNGTKVVIYMTFPPGAGSQVTLSGTNNFANQTISVIVFSKTQYVTLPAPPQMAKQVVPLDSGTTEAIAPDVAYGGSPASGQYAIVGNSGTVSVDVSSLQFAVSTTVIPSSDLQYSNPLVAALPWVAIISSDTVISPGGSVQIPIPSNYTIPSTSNFYMRSSYAGTTSGAPVDSGVLYEPAPFLLGTPPVADTPTMPVWGLIVLGAILAMVGVQQIARTDHPGARSS